MNGRSGAPPTAGRRLRRVRAHRRRRVHNPFLGIAACDLSAACPPVPPHVWRMFQDSCRYRGLNSALAQLPKAERQKYRQALSAAKQPWWEPEQFWEQWQPAIDAVGLLTPSIP